MVKYCLLCVLIILGLHPLYGQHTSVCPAMNETITISQVDGSSLTIHGVGNNLLSYTETEDGYTLLPNGNGIYEYVIVDKSGLIKPSGVKANNFNQRNKTENTFLAQILPHLHYAPKQAEQLILIHRGFSNEVLNKTSTSQAGNYPSTGKRKILMLLIQFPGLKSKYPDSSFNNMMNLQGYKGTGSFNNYYFQNSYTKLNMEVDVFGWYTADTSYLHYGNQNTDAAARQLVVEAVNAAHTAGVDFSKYDNDGDSIVDGIMVVHSGYGAEEGGRTQYIWSHHSYLGNKSVTYNNVKIDRYTIQPEVRGRVQRMAGIGVFCHEFGHMLGLPDMYDTKGSSEGDGEYELMAGGAWLNKEKTPSSLSAFSKIWLGWVNPKIITDSGKYLLKAAAADSTIYKTLTPVQGEYYLLENRQPNGYDAALPAKGLAIWHVDEKIMNSASPEWAYNSVNNNISHPGLALMQADGKNDLEKGVNRGDSGDFYPGSTVDSSFGDNTLPNAKSYSGRNSGISISTIKQLADSSIIFGFSALPGAIAGVDNNLTSACEGSSLTFINQSVYANRYKWNFHDGSAPDTNRMPVHSFTKSGTYIVSLSVYNKANQRSGDSLDILIYPQPRSSFTDKLSSSEVTVYNASTQAANYLWKWGDGKIDVSSQIQIKHTYKDTGLYRIVLTATGQGGCQDTISKTILIHTLSGIESVVGQIPSFGNFFPNPFKDQIYFWLNGGQSRKLQLSLYDETGKMIQRNNETVFTPGSNNLDFINSQLNTGIYFIIIAENGKPLYRSPVFKN
jgi:M6 family metalloprotease-like protein